MPEKAKKLKKVIQPKQCYTLKERRMIENGGVDSQKQLYFKGLSQAVALPSGAAPEVEKKLEPEVQLSSEVEVSKSSEVDEKTSKKIKRSRTRSQYSNLSRFSKLTTIYVSYLKLNFNFNVILFRFQIDHFSSP